MISRHVRPLIRCRQLVPEDIGHVHLRLVKLSARAVARREEAPDPVAIQVFMTPTLKEQTDERVVLGIDVRAKVDGLVEVGGTFEVSTSYNPGTCPERPVAGPRSLEFLSRIASGPIENVVRHAVSLVLSEYQVARNNAG